MLRAWCFFTSAAIGPNSRDRFLQLVRRDTELPRPVFDLVVFVYVDAACVRGHSPAFVIGHSYSHVHGNPFVKGRHEHACNFLTTTRPRPDSDEKSLPVVRI